MPQGKSYMPGTHAEQVAWSANLNTVVGEAPEAYGVPAAMMAQFGSLNATLQNGWAVVRNRESRRPTDVTAFKTALRAMKVAARSVVGYAQATPGVTDEMKRAAGMTVRKTTPSRRNTPPQAHVQAEVKGNQLVVYVADEPNPVRRRKPAGVDDILVFTHVGPTPPPPGEKWAFASTTGRSRVQIPLPVSEATQTVWVTAFYVNTSKVTGPAADPVSVTVAPVQNLPGEAELPTRIRRAA
jgi:hypothetical protein